MHILLFKYLNISVLLLITAKYVKIIPKNSILKINQLYCILGC